RQPPIAAPPQDVALTVAGPTSIRWGDRNVSFRLIARNTDKKEVGICKGPIYAVVRLFDVNGRLVWDPRPSLLRADLAHMSLREFVELAPSETVEMVVSMGDSPKWPPPGNYTVEGVLYKA